MTCLRPPPDNERDGVGAVVRAIMRPKAVAKTNRVRGHAPLTCAARCSMSVSWRSGLAHACLSKMHMRGVGVGTIAHGRESASQIHRTSSGPGSRPQSHAWQSEVGAQGSPGRCPRCAVACEVHLLLNAASAPRSRRESAHACSGGGRPIGFTLATLDLAAYSCLCLGSATRPAGADITASSEA